MRPTHIILHHSFTKDSNTVSWSAIKEYHTKELHWSDVGYHYGIERIGESYQILLGRMMTDPGAHCRESGMNNTSLGICFVGNYDLAEPPPDMWRLGLRLVMSLREVFLIPRDHVCGHHEYAGYKSCPGKKFDMDRFRWDLVAKI